MSIENLFKEILRLHPNITKEQLQEMINAKVEEAKGFLTVESAARAIAMDLHIESLEIPSIDRIAIKDLTSGLGDVTITARVIFVGSIKKFSTLDGTEVRCKHLIVADKTGELKVVLWGSNADTAESLNLLGQTVQFLHGYMRQGYNGKIELNLGSKGTFCLVEDNFQKKEVPPLIYFHKKICEITNEMKKVNVIGVVANVFAASSFVRENGSIGILKRFELQDETGVISVVLWDTKVQELKNVEKGNLIQLYEAKVKETRYGCIELHVDSSANTSILRELPFGYEKLLFQKKKS